MITKQEIQQVLDALQMGGLSSNSPHYLHAKATLQRALEQDEIPTRTYCDMDCLFECKDKCNAKEKT